MTATAAFNDHTPGPWTIQGSSINNVERRENICQWHVDIDKQPADHQANARLIAACPETAAERDQLREVNAELLYELEQACLSLDELAKEYVEGIGHNATARGVREQTRRARAAIEKARKEG